MVANLKLWNGITWGKNGGALEWNAAFILSLPSPLLHINGNNTLCLFVKNRIEMALAWHGLVLQKWSEKNESLTRSMQWNLMSCSGHCHKCQSFVYLAPPANLCHKRKRACEDINHQFYSKMFIKRLDTFRLLCMLWNQNIQISKGGKVMALLTAITFQSLLLHVLIIN